MHPPKDLGLVRFQVTTGEQMRALYAIEDAHSLLVSIEDSEGGVVCDRKNIQLYKMGEGFISEPLALEVGEYRLTEFLVLDDQEQVIFATPIEGSEKAYLVDDPLPIEFSVSKDVVTTVTPEVLDTEEAIPEDFGYGGFSFEVVETFVFLVSVFVETQTGMELTEAQLTVTSGVEVLYSGSLGAETNAIEVRDGYGMYDVLVEKEGHESYEQSFTDVELKGYFESPLIVVLVESGVSNTLTIVYSTPLLTEGEEGYIEGTGIFTFDADGVPQNYDCVFKMESGESAEAVRFLLTVTETRSGTTAFEQVVAHDSEIQYFLLDNFDDPVPDFDTSSEEYEKWTTTLVWGDDNLLLEEITTRDSVLIEHSWYEYNVDNTVHAIRFYELEEGEYDRYGAYWYLYGEENFPLLPVEERNYSRDLELIPPGYDYAEDPDNYKDPEGWDDFNDCRFLWTPHANGQVAELIHQWGNAWTSTWSNDDKEKFVWTYDSSGVPTILDYYLWDNEWILFIRFEATISGNAPSILDVSSVWDAIDRWGDRVIAAPFQILF